MKPLKISKTRSTPEINLDPVNNLIQIMGESYPENAGIFYHEVMNWLTEYFKDKNRKITVELKITYLNTSSSKIVTEILEMIQDFHNNNGNIFLNWYYEEDDEDSLDNGEIFLEEHTFPYKLVPFLDE
ncbi:MAG: hypothetical protein B6D62_02460 [Candidatus Cloacimonas sp. 4484_275]|nr:MAG: hypothetical protein B6D62_02460 [Candidatus Cloacimonas sp. 4484_275]